MKSEWIVIKEGSVPLRCWWSKPSQGRDEIVEGPNRVALVLPEIFGVNNWVRSVADRLATRGIPALAMPLFSRTAPELELGYSEDNLIEGRRHKDSTSMEQILTDTYTAICWLNKQLDQPQITVIGFCFGGHAALITATMTEVSETFNFYGAGVSKTRPGGGAPSLELLPQVSGRLTCLCGTADPLIPTSDRQAIQAALRMQDPDEERLRYIEINGADHGFMCEERESFAAEASALGWRLLLESFER